MFEENLPSDTGEQYAGWQSQSEKKASLEPVDILRGEVTQEARQHSPLPKQSHREQYRGVRRVGVDAVGQVVTLKSPILLEDGTVVEYHQAYADGRLSWNVDGTLRGVVVDIFMTRPELLVAATELRSTGIPPAELTLEAPQASFEKVNAAFSMQDTSLNFTFETASEGVTGANNIWLESKSPKFLVQTTALLGKPSYLPVPEVFRKNLDLSEGVEIFFRVLVEKTEESSQLQVTVSVVEGGVNAKRLLSEAGAESLPNPESVEQDKKSFVAQLLARETDSIPLQQRDNNSGSYEDTTTNPPEQKQLQAVEQGQEQTPLLISSENREDPDWNQQVDANGLMVDLQQQMASPNGVAWHNPMVFRLSQKMTIPYPYRIPWNHQAQETQKEVQAIERVLEKEMAGWRETQRKFAEAESVVWFVQSKDDFLDPDVGLGDMVYLEAVYTLLAKKYPHKQFFIVGTKRSALPSNSRLSSSEFSNITFVENTPDLRQHKENMGEKIVYVDGSILTIDATEPDSDRAQQNTFFIGQLAAENADDGRWGVVNFETFQPREAPRPPNALQKLFRSAIDVLTGKKPLFARTTPAPLETRTPFSDFTTGATLQLVDAEDEEALVAGRATKLLPDTRSFLYREQMYGADGRSNGVDTVQVADAFSASSVLQQQLTVSRGEDANGSLHQQLHDRAVARQDIFPERQYIPHQVEVAALMVSLLTGEPVSPSEIIESLPVFEYQTVPDDEQYDVCIVYDVYSSQSKLLQIQSLCQMINAAVMQGKRVAVVKGLDNPEIVDALLDIYGPDVFDVVEKPSIQEVMSVLMAAGQVITVDTVFMHLLDLGVEQRLAADPTAQVPDVTAVMCTDSGMSVTQYMPRNLRTAIIDGQMGDVPDDFYPSLIHADEANS